MSYYVSNQQDHFPYPIPRGARYRTRGRVPKAQRKEEFFGSKVTRARLYPHLKYLLQNERSHRFPQSVSRAFEDTDLPQGLMEALKEYVFNKMPCRLIQLLQMELIGRNQVVDLVAMNMIGIDEALIDKMVAKIDTLGKERLPESAQDTEELEEEDARDNTWDAICQFLFQEFARYAILSHTWLDADDEIVYQATFERFWQNSYSPNHAGFDKLKGFCDVAYYEHGVSLAWIDTLCINKDSSTELDEAIQSMYKWYQNSSICITYLRGTTSLDHMHLDNWFLRGWTLQELIAPKKMQFYNVEWERLSSEDAEENDKANAEIQHIIYMATGISEQELLSFDPLTGSDIATRMSWAAARTTTRGEDQAYSLMGIFGVKFPTSYGEGPERAFFRLIEAIITSRHTSHIIRSLLWAGKSISDTIHTSRLIPSQPDCYLVDLQCESLVDDWQTSAISSNHFPALSKPMSLTHLGLRVRLLLISAKLVGLEKLHSAQRYGPFNINISLNFPPSSFEPITQLLDKRYSEVPLKHQFPTGKDTHFGHSFFLGIYTFREDIHDNCVQIPFSSNAFILHVQNPFVGFGIRHLTSNHFYPGAKIDTRNIVQAHTVHQGCGSSVRSFRSYTEDGCGFDVIGKEDLAAMNMTLLNVYL